jgi:hypothetical protein
LTSRTVTYLFNPDYRSNTPEHAWPSPATHQDVPTILNTLKATYSMDMRLPPSPTNDSVPHK